MYITGCGGSSVSGGGVEAFRLEGSSSSSSSSGSSSSNGSCAPVGAQVLRQAQYRLSKLGAKVQELDPYHEVGDVDALAEKLEQIVEASLATNLPPKQGIGVTSSEGSRPLRESGERVRGLRIKYDMGKYDWDRIARQVSEVYEGL